MCRENLSEKQQKRDRFVQSEGTRVATVTDNPNIPEEKAGFKVSERGIEVASEAN
jgi:hypothetical protein